MALKQKHAVRYQSDTIFVKKAYKARTCWYSGLPSDLRQYRQDRLWIKQTGTLTMVPCHRKAQSNDGVESSDGMLPGAWGWTIIFQAQRQSHHLKTDSRVEDLPHKFSDSRLEGLPHRSE